MSFRSLALAALVFLACGGGGGDPAPVVEATDDPTPAAPAPAQPAPEPVPSSFSFSVAGDMRAALGPTEFGGVLAALADLGPGEFLVSPGDLDPPADVRASIDAALGADFPWLAVVGNHEVESPAHMAYLRARGAGPLLFATNFRPGPGASAATTYAFDAGDAHFVVLNQYFDGRVDDFIPSNAGLSGDVSPALLEWLEADLAAAEARSPRYVFVIGHEPAWPMADADGAAARHVGDSLDAHPQNRDAFWEVLKAHRVTAYFCGHTHGFSVHDIGGVLQVDTGHSKGAADVSPPSTFLRVDLEPSGGVMTTWRATPDGAYEPHSVVQLVPRS
ncbi:MAG TPA: metallophosphoesterase [Anaeromyxobacteraceae bacterium]|nr:metallophosphoesterase [Anaeromyxobacteraceae bacterium]